MHKAELALLLGLVVSCQGRGVTASAVNDVFPDREVAQLAGAACEGDVAGIENALSNGADVNGRGRDQITPLFWAMNCRNIEGVRRLLAHGADPNARIHDGVSLVWLAATYNEGDYLRALVQVGGDVNGTEENADTSALMGGMTSGFQNDFWDNYYFVLESGADVNIRYGPAPGITIAEKAVGLGLFDKALELIERGYNRDLDRLERFAQGRQIDEDSPQAGARRRLLERLADLRRNLTSSVH